MAKLFLLAGQSNMVGAGITDELPDHLLRAPAGVRLFQDGAFRDLTWRHRFGPEVGFAHAVAAALPGEPVVLCKAAVGGANLHYDWNPDGTSRGPEDDYRGPLYPRLIAELAAARAALAAEGDSADPVGMLWMQGERDSVFDFMARAYADNLAGLIAAVRRDTGAPALPFVVAIVAPRTHTLADGFKHAFRQIVQQAQADAPRAIPGVAAVETRDLPQFDNLHYDAGGQIELGRRFAAAWLTLASGLPK